MQDGGTPALEAVLLRLAALDDAGLRPKLVAALARQEAPELAARAAALWSRPELRQQERGHLFFTLGSAAPTREAFLAELEQRGDALLDALNWLYRSIFPLVFADGCDAAFAERLRAALEPRLGARPEMRRSLAQALERIAICSAEREAEADRIAAFLAAAAPRALSGR